MKNFLSIIFLFCCYTAAQTASLKIDDVTSSINERISVPIIAQNLSDVSAVSLKIRYDNQTVNFAGIENAAANFQYSENDGIITIGWFDVTLMNPVELENAPLLNLLFDISSGSSSLEFIENSCEISNSLGETIPINYINGSITIVTSVDREPFLNEYKLLQNYPNPFNSSTIISFNLREKEKVTLTIYNLLGQEIAQLVNSELEAGKYNINFDAEQLSAGVYFYRLKTEIFSSVRKLILNK